MTKNISDILWHFPLDKSLTIIFMNMKYIHSQNKNVPKLTPQEKEIEQVFNLSAQYNGSPASLMLHTSKPKNIEYIANNLNFLVKRYNGPKKQSYLNRLEEVKQIKTNYGQEFVLFIAYHLSIQLRH
ncbi:hypothetical protein J4465_02895 [Candidatus Pacearchaeota archaeon]|nr:hypothetical protein [Candidatus Pacearchaeota archaeon]